jgi:hypothetical protein
MMRASRVRPYAITGGRTRPDHDLAMDTRIVATQHDPARTATLQPESQAICDQAAHPISVANLAACLTAIPTTTLLVLLGDLIADGMLRVDDGVPTQRDMLGRILDGLKELSP